MKKKRNNKGFTLVEVLIAMAIISVVFTLGYNIILGMDKTTTKQTEVYTEQQNANLINKYLTKDLEQVKTFTTADTTLNPYSYIINDGVEGSERIEYEVLKVDNGKSYNLTRKTDSGSIELISNYPTDSEIPFSITKVASEDNLFKVSMNGKSGDNEVSKYQFEVSSRVEHNVASVEPPKLPEVDNNNGENNSTQTPVNTSVGGVIEFGYERDDGKNEVEFEVEAFENNKEVKERDKEIAYTLNANTEYTLCARIPLKDKDLRVYLKDGNKIVGDNGIFGTGNDWKLFENANNNNSIYVYSGSRTNISSIKIKPHTATNAIVHTNINRIFRNEVNVTSSDKYIDIEITFKLAAPIPSDDAHEITIGFGKFMMDND